MNEWSFDDDVWGLDGWYGWYDTISGDGKGWVLRWSSGGWWIFDSEVDRLVVWRLEVGRLEGGKVAYHACS